MGACDFIVTPHYPVWFQVYFMFTGYAIALVLMLFSYVKILLALRRSRKLNERQAKDTTRVPQYLVFF